MDDMAVFLTMLGVVFGSVIVWIIITNIRNNMAKNSKSISKKAEIMIKKDMSSPYARCTFYMNNDYDNGYSQSEWMKLFKDQVIDQGLDKDSEEYAEAVAPFINAIVVNDSGSYMRRGMENMVHSLERFEPGVNDRISLNYFVEPYEYVKDEERAIISKAEAAARRKKWEEEAPLRAARARCDNCVHNRSCNYSVKQQLGSCGGYTPKEKKNPFL